MACGGALSQFSASHFYTQVHFITSLPVSLPSGNISLPPFNWFRFGLYPSCRQTRAILEFIHAIWCPQLAAVGMHLKRLADKTQEFYLFCFRAAVQRRKLGRETPFRQTSI